jgi:hypothetical protein
MHAKAKGRKVLASLCVITFLTPIVLTLYATAGEWERFARWIENPVFIVMAVATGLLIAGVVWWKGAASAPEVILIPAGAFLICQSAGVFRYEAHSAQTETKPPAISIDSYAGTEVRCNGVLLGTTPLTMTLDEFAKRVAPVGEPPVQEAAFRWSRSSTDSLASINWSALPFDPFKPDSSSLGQTTDVIEKRFAESRYFWTFKIGEFQAARSGVRFSKHNDELSLHIHGWETISRHAQTLKVLAKEESVDPLIAYADHIDAHPPLRLELTPRQYHESPPTIRHSYELERYSNEPLSFQEAVIRRDWLWIARSNDSRSVPLLKLFLENSREHHHDDRSILTFRDHVVAILMDSEEPEIQQIVRRIMSSADWTHSDVLKYYIERQLESEADREDLTSWLAGRRSELNNYFLPLMLRIGGKNFAEEAGPFSDSEWSAYMQNSPDVPDVVVEWLAKQWQESPSGRLTMGLARLPEHPIAYAAVAESNLSTATNVRDFMQILNSSSRSDWMKEALSETASKALAAATEESHISELARFLERVPTDIGLAALEEYDGPDNRTVDRSTTRVRDALKRQKQKLEADIQLARDLISGSQSPRDLVDRLRFEWKDGTYVQAEL